MSLTNPHTDSGLGPQVLTYQPIPGSRLFIDGTTPVPHQYQQGQRRTSSRSNRGSSRRPTVLVCAAPRRSGPRHSRRSPPVLPGATVLVWYRTTAPNDRAADRPRRSPQPPIAAADRRPCCQGRGTGVVPSCSPAGHHRRRSPPAARAAVLVWYRSTAPVASRSTAPVAIAGARRRRSPLAGSPATAADRGTGVVPSCSPAGRPRRSPPPPLAGRAARATVLVWYRAALPPGDRLIRPVVAQLRSKNWPRPVPHQYRIEMVPHQHHTEAVPHRYRFGVVLVWYRRSP